MQNKCYDQNASSQYSPFGQLKFPLNIPNDPRRKCKGFCSESNDKNVQITKQIVDQPSGDKKARAKYRPTSKTVNKLSSSESGLSFLQVGNNYDNMENRTVRYQDAPGSSFGAHLLRKSVPLLSDALDQKLKFKRDSEAGNLSMQQRRRLTQPVFINEIDSDEIIPLKETDSAIKRSTCTPPPPIKRNMVHNQFLTTNSRAKQGLKYVMATNFPHLPPDPPTGSPPLKHEIKDTCGRKSHHPKLRARDLGKRLCEVPSMTKELDDLYKEYTDRCVEGGDQSEACRFLRHAPSPHHREPRRSILKDQRASAVEVHQQQRKSSGRGHLVHFDKEVDLMSTAITKVNGIDASLRETDGRLKLLRQLGGRITAVGAQTEENFHERYPLHVRDPKTFPPQGPMDWLKMTEQEDLEEKTAKQDLARIYFTTEATRLIACANLASLDRKTNVFIKTDKSGRPPFPHFFMDRLADDLETENKRKKEDKLVSIKNEMDAFDQSVREQSSTSTPPSNFDPLQVPSEKSLNDLKLKVEIMKRKREQDVLGVARRNRTRKSYFRQMLPCFADVIRNDLMDYAIKRACKLSGEEKILAGDLLIVAKQQDVLEKHKRKYEQLEEEEEELLTEDVEEVAGPNQKMMRDILEVCIDVAVKISNYKTTTGKDPPEGLRREWRDAGFSLLNQQDPNYGHIEQDAELVCGAEEEEDDTGSQSNVRRLSELSNETLDEMGDASTSGRDDGDDNHARCIVALSAMRNSTGGRLSTDETKPKTTVRVQVTDCLHEDIESALTYDGLFLPLTESQLTQSSSETQTDTSGSPSVTPTDSPEESFTECMNINQIATKQLDGFDYEEYEGEDEAYFDENGEVVVPGSAGKGFDPGSDWVRMEGELTEETGTEGGEGPHVGEVEVQAIDYSEGDSPDAGKQKVKGLHFDESADKRAVTTGENTTKGTKSGDSKISLKDKDSLKFQLPDNFVSKRAPVQRKPTAFHPKHSFDDDDDDLDDDDDDDIKEVLGDDRPESELIRSSFQSNADEGIENDEDEHLNEIRDEHEDTTGSSKTDRPKSKTCTGPSKRKILVYEELENISYGMNNTKHEKKFLEHRAEQLKHFSETWGKGLYKPPNVFTIHEKNPVPFSNKLTGKRMPPFNILDTSIRRPHFNLRMKNLIRKAEQAKREKVKCNEERLERDLLENSQTIVGGNIKRTCSEILKGKSKKRPSWQEEIAEYECRRKEREKLMAETEVDNDYAKRLGFDVFSNDLRQTFVRHANSHVHIANDTLFEEHEETSENIKKKSSLGKKKPMTCVSGPDGTLPDIMCLVDEDEAEGLEEEEDLTQNIKCDEEEDCQIPNTKYLEIPGEGFYETNLEYPLEYNDGVEEEMFSIQDVYNE